MGVGSRTEEKSVLGWRQGVAESDCRTVRSQMLIRSPYASAVINIRMVASRQISDCDVYAVLHIISSGEWLHCL